MISISGDRNDAYTRLPYFNDEWAIILAGGDGTRLKPLTRTLTGDERPKQFCSLLGEETLLEQTWCRTELMISPERTLAVVNSAHEPYYDPILSNLPAQSLVVQSENRGTGAAILYSLLRVAARAPLASVAIFPSDHFVSNDMAFMAHVGAAFQTTRRKPESVVLLGIRPDYPEVEYGWIEPGEPVSLADEYEIMTVERFWEKPPHSTAQKLMARGGLWNSFVMVGRVSAFLGLIKNAAPELYRAFAAIRRELGSMSEAEAVGELYSVLPLTNFSEEVLVPSSASLGVLPVRDLWWSDLGEPSRVYNSLSRIGIKPDWDSMRMSA